VARIVAGAVDPNPRVDGQGIAQLCAAGVEVTTGVLGGACRQLLAPFIARTVHGRPYVTLKWAQSADGKMAGPGGRRVWISNERSRQAVHELRARCDAILVGSGTILADDPLLTVRGTPPLRPLTRVVLDARGRLTPDHAIVRSAGEGRVIVYVGESAGPFTALVGAGVEVRPVAPDATGGIPLERVCADLCADGATHLLVEGGPTVARAFLAANLADRAWVFRGTGTIGDPTAPDAPALGAGFVTTGGVPLAGDELTEWLDARSLLFFAPQSSADLALVACDVRHVY